MNRGAAVAQRVLLIMAPLRSLRAIWAQRLFGMYTSSWLVIQIICVRTYVPHGMGCGCCSTGLDWTRRRRLGLHSRVPSASVLEMADERCVDGGLPNPTGWLIIACVLRTRSVAERGVGGRDQRP